MSIHSVLEAFLKRYANHLAIVLTAIAVGVASTIIMPLFTKPLDVKGKVRPRPSNTRSHIEREVELIVIALLYYRRVYWIGQGSCCPAHKARSTRYDRSEGF